MNTRQYFLFPQTVLSETDYRHLALLVPNLQLLQISREPDLPQWGKLFFSARPVISEEHAQQIKVLLKNYRSFAELVGEGTTLAAVSRLRDDMDWRESRFRIQSSIKGRDPSKELVETQTAILEAGLFLEMANDLDRQGIELEEDIAKAGNLEKEFRHILGVTAEDGMEGDLAVGESLIGAGKSYMSFMLEKRMAYWLRLFCTGTEVRSPALVSVVPQVAEEFIDPLTSVDVSPSQPSEKIIRMPVVTIPSLAALQGEEFKKLIDKLKGLDILQTYWQALEDVLAHLGDSASTERLNTAASQLQTTLSDYLRLEENTIPQHMLLSLVILKNMSLGDIWAGLDKEGSRLLETNKTHHKPVLALLCEQASP